MSDIYGDQTVLLLHCEGTDGSTQFLDSAYRNAVTAVGNARISTAQKKFDSSSAYFDGVGDYLSLPDSENWTFGSGDFTIEGWFRVGAMADWLNIISNRTSTASNNAFGIYLNASSQLKAQFSTSGTAVTHEVIAASIPTNVWNHFAVARYGSLLAIYVNGVQAAQIAITGPIFNSTSGVYIGSDNGVGSYFNGYIDDFRITKGVARYTANFTPPTAPFDDPVIFKADDSPLYWDETKLLMHFDGANGSTYFRDEKHNSVSNVSSPVLSTTNSKFGGAAYYNDGSAKYATVPGVRDNSSFTLPGDFTIECWFNASDTTGNVKLLNAYAAWATSVYINLEFTTDGYIWFSAGDNVPIAITSDSKIVAGAWYHIAVCRSAGVSTMYLNGVPQSTRPVSAVTIDAAHILGNGKGLGIGGNTWGNQFWRGYIDEIRFTKGVARYTERFIPPTKAFPDLKQFDPHWNSVVSAIPMNDLTLSDLKGNNVSKIGSVALSTVKAKFNGVSAYFNGAGDYLSVAASEGLNFATGDFTVEGWVHPLTPTGAYPVFFGNYTGGSEDIGLLIFADGSGHLLYSTTYGYFASETIPVNTWSHIAICRSGGVLSLLVAGTRRLTVSASMNLGRNNTPMTIGCINSGSLGHSFKGYINAFRVTKGVARYTDAVYTTPTEPFPTTVPESLSGVVHDSAGNPIQRKALSYRRDTGQLIGTAMSDPVTGAFSLPADNTDEHFVVVLDDTKNALIYDHITPVAP